MKNDVRAATVLAVTECELLQINRAIFAKLLGPLEDIMKQQNAVYEDTDGINLVEKKEAAEKVHVPFSDLQIVGTLGKGSFGYVQLVLSALSFPFPSPALSFPVRSLSSTQFNESKFILHGDS